MLFKIPCTILIVTLVWLSVTVATPLHGSESSGKASEFLSPSPKCGYDCQGAPKAHFCASNGRTVYSECAMRKAKCNDRYLNFTAGDCRNSQRCQLERTHNLMVQSLPDFTQTVIIPTCKTDGSYTSTQCNMFFGQCWCVTSIGRMVKNSTFKIGSSRRCERSRASKRRCNNVADKAAFALKLRDFILNESGRRSPHKPVDVRVAVNRRHEQMDRNGDGSLSSKEMRRLLKPYRKKLPKSCRKVFWKFCDYDGNRQISAAEWGLCLGVRQRVTEQTKRSPGPDIVIPEKNPPGPPLKETETTSRRVGSNDTLSSTSPLPSRTCRKDRQELLKGHKKFANIPDCEGPNDRFWRPVQCLGQYCFCVVRETGVPLQSSAVHISEGRPNCELASRSIDIPIPIPGCPSKKKPTFLTSVQKLLTKKMINSTRDHGEEGEPLKERSARWYFDTLDGDGNRLLGRKETKAFKKLLANHRIGREFKRCLKKFTKHCDRNADGKISLDEFLWCLEVTRQRKPLPRYPYGSSINQLKTTDDPDNK